MPENSATQKEDGRGHIDSSTNTDTFPDSIKLLSWNVEGFINKLGA